MGVERQASNAVWVSFTRIGHIAGEGGGHFCERVARLATIQGLEHLFTPHQKQVKTLRAEAQEQFSTNSDTAWEMSNLKTEMADAAAFAATELGEATAKAARLEVQQHKQSSGVGVLQACLQALDCLSFSPPTS